MKHYYLFNNRTWMTNEKMPTYSEHFETYAYFENRLSQWKDSLQPCEISESELYKVKGMLVHTRNALMATYDLDFNNPIEVTDIVESKVTHQLLRNPPIDCYELFFKQPSDNNGVITFKEVDKYGYVKCGDCNKFYLCTNCGAQCGSEGHFIEPKQVDGEIEAVLDDILKIMNVAHTKNSGWYNYIKDEISNKYTITRNL